MAYMESTLRIKIMDGIEGDKRRIDDIHSFTYLGYEY